MLSRETATQKNCAAKLLIRTMMSCLRFRSIMAVAMPGADLLMAAVGMDSDKNRLDRHSKMTHCDERKQQRMPGIIVHAITPYNRQ